MSIKTNTNLLNQSNTFFLLLTFEIEMKESVPPIMNDKIRYVTVKIKDSVVIPCVAYANPKPIYRYVFSLMQFIKY